MIHHESGKVKENRGFSPRFALDKDIKDRTWMVYGIREKDGGVPPCQGGDGASHGKVRGAGSGEAEEEETDPGGDGEEEPVQPGEAGEVEAAQQF